jgi:hypothetical protein
MALRYKVGIKIPKNTRESSTCIDYTVFNNSYNKFMKFGTASAPAPRLLDQVREQIRYLHYSLSTEKSYLCWAKFFVCCPVAAEVQAVLSMLAADRRASRSTRSPARGF